MGASFRTGSRCGVAATAPNGCLGHGESPLQLNSDFINQYRRMFGPSAAAMSAAANKLMMPAAAVAAAAQAAASRLSTTMTTEDKG